MCTTELGRAAKLAPEFSKRNVKMIALSIDSVQDHLSWCKVTALGSVQGAACNPTQAWRDVCHIPKRGDAGIQSGNGEFPIFVVHPSALCSLILLLPC